MIGGSGKTGRRVVERLKALGHDVRGASRSSCPSFDWNNDSNWSEALAGVKTLFQAITGRELKVVDVSREEFVEGLEAAQLPEGMVQLVDYLFNEVLDGRNSSLSDGVQRALGRPPRDCRGFLQKAHLSGAFT